MEEQTAFQLPLLCTGGQRQEIEVVGIFENLRREIGIGRREGLLKVREGFPLSLMQPAADLMDQNIATPAMLDRRAQISFAILEPVQQNPEMTPG